MSQNVTNQRTKQPPLARSGSGRCTPLLTLLIVTCLSLSLSLFLVPTVPSYVGVSLVFLSPLIRVPVCVCVRISILRRRGSAISISESDSHFRSFFPTPTTTLRYIYHCVSKTHPHATSFHFGLRNANAVVLAPRGINRQWLSLLIDPRFWVLIAFFLLFWVLFLLWFNPAEPKFLFFVFCFFGNWWCTWILCFLVKFCVLCFFFLFLFILILDFDWGCSRFPRGCVCRCQTWFHFFFSCCKDHYHMVNAMLFLGHQW